MRSTTHHSRLTTHRPPGASITELIVVLLIILLLMSFTMNAILTMRKNSRLNASADRITSMLHLARNMAISNNAMYFVRINAADGTANDSNSDIQSVSIYYFLRSSDAVAFQKEPDPTTSPNAWNPGSLVTNPANGQPLINPSNSLPYNNVRVQAVYLEGNASSISDDDTAISYSTSTFCGINSPLGAQHFIGFNPDGSCSTPTIQLYVTDNKKFVADDAGRQNAISRSDVHVKTIRVFSGGLIKREF
jgi:Tfp pilus assembly protein FimT